mmetsp:Transcript_850/g.1951  ORF Transcript_850/g.1951 Transcript_850/m.1951 type:complete len:251 (-) Transcript_850:1272-2024(-)
MSKVLASSFAASSKRPLYLLISSSVSCLSRPCSVAYALNSAPTESPRAPCHLRATAAAALGHCNRLTNIESVSFFSGVRVVSTFSPLSFSPLSSSSSSSSSTSSPSSSSAGAFPSGFSGSAPSSSSSSRKSPRRGSSPFEVRKRASESSMSMCCDNFSSFSSSSFACNAFWPPKLGAKLRLTQTEVTCGHWWSTGSPPKVAATTRSKSLVEARPRTVQVSPRTLILAMTHVWLKLYMPNFMPKAGLSALS